MAAIMTTTTGAATVTRAARRAGRGGAVIAAAAAALILAAGCPNEVEEDTPKTLTISGITDVTGTVLARLSQNPSMVGPFVAWGQGTVEGQVVTLSLIAGDDSLNPGDALWTGSGQYYVMLWETTPFEGTPDWCSAPVDFTKTSTSLTVEWKKFYSTAGITETLPNKPEESAGSVIPVTWETNATRTTVPLTGLTNQTVYLVKVNSTANEVENKQTGGVVSGASSASAGVLAEAVAGRSAAGAGANAGLVSGVFVHDGETVIRRDHPGAQEFNHNPPVAAPGRSAAGRSAARTAADAARTAAVEVGSTQKTFHVDNSTTGKWYTVDATLQAQGDHANVWVADDNFTTTAAADDNKVTTKQAQDLAGMFDQIYGLETPVFGHEYGGGLAAADPDYGGVDADPRIQILLYDIDDDFKTYKNAASIIGYFWAKDEYEDGDPYIGTYRSNEAEIFYIDVPWTDASPDIAYSTLVHEFQHMINFNAKYLAQSSNTTWSETWFDEMLSQVAEDVIDPLIGIVIDASDDYNNGGGHPVNGRIPLFLAQYWAAGLTEWLTGNYVLISYSNVYAFGAFLARNYGGVDLINKIMTNDKDNEYAVDKALGGDGNLAAFKAAVAKFAETLVYNNTDDAHGSLNRTVTTKWYDTDYTFKGFDLWKIANYNAGYAYVKEPTAASDWYPAKGPVIVDTKYGADMGPYAILVQSCDDWRGVTGDLSVTLARPASGIDFYLMLK